MLEYPGQTPIYVVVDALDECPNTINTPARRDQVYSALGDIFEASWASRAAAMKGFYVLF